MSDLIKVKGKKGFTAVGLITISQYSVAFITQIILARILSPSEFGLLAISMLFGFFINNLANLHVDKFLIREKFIDESKLNSGFTLELLIAFILYLLLLVNGQWVLKLLGKSEIFEFVIVLGLSVFYIPFSRVKAIHERKLNFILPNLPGLISQIVSGLLSIILALKGYGIWSLIFWKINILFLEIIILIFFSKVKLRIKVNKLTYRSIIRYGFPLVISTLLAYLVSNIDYYIVERLISITELGYYWLAYQTTNYLLNLRIAISKVSLPLISIVDKESNKYSLFEAITNTTALIYTIPAIVIVVFGKEIITIVFGQNWLGSIVPFKIFSVIILVKSINDNSKSLFHAENRNDFDLKLSALNLIILIPALYTGTILYGIIGASLSILFSSILVSIYAYGYCVKKITDKRTSLFLRKMIISSGLLIVIGTFLEIYSLRFALRTTISVFMFMITFFVFKKEIKSILNLYLNKD